MNPLDDRAREERAKAERRRARLLERQFRADVQQMMELPASRRVLSAFFVDAGIDASAYRETPADMGFAVAWQDAARWWLTAIREHCPEREAQMRAEARKDAREGATPDEEGNEND